MVRITPPIMPLPSSSSIGLWPAVVGKSTGEAQDFMMRMRDAKTADIALQAFQVLEKAPDDRARRSILHKLRLERHRERVAELLSLETKMATLELEKNIIAELREWWEGTFVLQRPSGSAYHRFVDACENGQVALLLGKNEGDRFRRGTVNDITTLQGRQSFVVEHDWARAFEGAQDFDAGEVHLPYDRMVFEFLISGKRVCALLSKNYEMERIAPVIETKVGGWVWPNFIYERGERGVEPSRVSGDKALDGMRQLLLKQIRAICISLEAEVATTEIVRAPHKLNRSREKNGRAPLIDYHVVKLAHRARAATLPEASDTEKRTSPRLHFRRGHWRHFQNHKTWVKWMLCGNPDLGFIDKHYRL